MLSERVKAMSLAERKARSQSVFGWGILAFFLMPIAIIAVHSRRPRVPTHALLSLEPTDDEVVVELFEARYSEDLKSRQVKVVWIWAGLGLLTNIMRVALFPDL